MEKSTYFNSILIINLNGQVVRIFTPFEVFAIETKQKYWVSKIIWEASGLPFFEINGKFISCSKFKIL